jgi:hypothetical protein
VGKHAAKEEQAPSHASQEREESRHESSPCREGSERWEDKQNRPERRRDGASTAPQGKTTADGEKGPSNHKRTLPGR